MPVNVARSPGQRVRSQDHNNLLSSFLVEHLNEANNYHTDSIHLGNGTNNDDKCVIANNLAGERSICWRESEGCWGELVGGVFSCFATEAQTSHQNADILTHTQASGLISGIIVSNLTQNLNIYGEEFPSSLSGVTITLGRHRVIGGPFPIPTIVVDDTVCVPPGVTLGNCEDNLITHSQASGLIFTDNLVGGPHRFIDIVKGSDRSFVPDYQGAVEYDPTSSTGTLSKIFDLTDKHNFYKWESSEATTQERTIVVRAKLQGFWNWSDGIKLWYKTSDTSGLGVIDVSMYDTAGNSVFLSGGSGLKSSTLTSKNISVGAGTFDNEGYITILFKMSAEAGRSVYLGQFELDYSCPVT